MAISREEIEQIAEAVAKRVVTPELLCSCGYNVLRAAHSRERLRLDISAKNKESAERELANFKRNITDIEKTCHVKLDKAFDSVGDASKAIIRESWPAALTQTVKAAIDIENALHQASGLR